MRLANPHMVRHEIQQLAHLVRVQLGNPGIVFLPRADGRVELVVVGNVVAVQAFGASLEVRRDIAIAHA